MFIPVAIIMMLSGHILTAFKQDPEVVKEAHDYLLVLIPAIFFYALNDVQKKFLTQIGHS
jgi:MATE family multidrug resistance protein